MSDDRKLTPKQIKAVGGLLQGLEPIEIQRRHKIPQRTLWRWRHEDPLFMRTFAKGQADLLREAKGEIKAATNDAIRRLRSIVSNDMAGEAAQVAAARTILDQAFKNLELEEIEERLVEAEDALRAQEGGLRVVEGGGDED